MADLLPDRPVLLTASSGGHFTELELVADNLGIPERSRHWAVPRHPQTLDRLSGVRGVTWMPAVHSRDLAGARRNLASALRLHRRLQPAEVVSTGAAQAVPHLLAAAALGTPITYVESAARLDGPSVTGRIAALLPRTRVLAAEHGWGGRWQPGPDAFSAFRAEHGVPGTVRNAVVALGSERYPFGRAVREVERVLGAVPITWQVGNTVSYDGVERNRWLPPERLEESMAGASVVVTHGGAGSVLTALGTGQVPVVFPRLPEFGEHCDHHQLVMCQRLAARGLVVLVRPGDFLRPEHLARATASRAVRVRIEELTRSA